MRKYVKYADVQSHMCTHKRANIYTHARTHTHTHTHTYSHQRKSTHTHSSLIDVIGATYKGLI